MRFKRLGACNLVLRDCTSDRGSLRRTFFGVHPNDLVKPGQIDDIGQIDREIVVLVENSQAFLRQRHQNKQKAELIL